MKSFGSAHPQPTTALGSHWLNHISRHSFFCFKKPIAVIEWPGRLNRDRYLIVYIYCMYTYLNYILYMQGSQWVRHIVGSDRLIDHPVVVKHSTNDGSTDTRPPVVGRTDFAWGCQPLWLTSTFVASFFAKTIKINRSKTCVALEIMSELGPNLWGARTTLFLLFLKDDLW